MSDPAQSHLDGSLWEVIDLFSGAGGMSYGFHAHPAFRIVGAADKQIAKPSSKPGSLDCNLTYADNIGIEPANVDLADVSPEALRKKLLPGGKKPVIMCSCAPCTGLSRTNPDNHLEDDPRNALVPRSALFAEAFRPAVFLMENARELITGNYDKHYLSLRRRLERLGYEVRGEVHMLDRFGLPQKRERALVVATLKEDERFGKLEPKTLSDLWEGYRVRNEAKTVRRAISQFDPVEAGEEPGEDLMHEAPGMTKKVLRRMQAIPADGGSWTDLAGEPIAGEVLTPSMLRKIEKGNLGSHPDVYGRMAWDEPAPTIKRECAHIGNGRYSHPEQDRLLTVREMATLQGFPSGYRFVSSSRSNRYRHVGDAVPPLISHQLAHLSDWILTGEKPEMNEILLPDTHLRAADIRACESKPGRETNAEAPQYELAL